VTPVTVGATVTVAANSNTIGNEWSSDYYDSFNNHGLVFRDSTYDLVQNPIVHRVTAIGNEAYTTTGGSVSLTVNGQPYASARGVPGTFQDRKVHTVTIVPGN
jgi:hypothetical protein